jgi:hypothetical protein
MPICQPTACKYEVMFEDTQQAKQILELSAPEVFNNISFLAVDIVFKSQTFHIRILTD